MRVSSGCLAPDHHGRPRHVNGRFAEIVTANEIDAVYYRFHFAMQLS